MTYKNLEGAVGLDDAERVAANRHLRDVQDRCHDKKHKAPGTVAETFGFATELVNHDDPANADPSAKLGTVRNAFATAQVATKEAKTVSFIAEVT